MAPVVRHVAAALLCPLVGGGALAQTTTPLNYVESSTGLFPPQWEGGRTTLMLADVNGDGHPDIVSIGDHGSPNINSQLHGVSVWFGDGVGGWTSYQTGTFGYGGVAVGDLNWDGDPDIAYGMHHNYSTSDFGDQLIEAALGDGTGMNWTPWDDGLATNGEKYGMFGVALADFDADGDLDLVSNSFGCCAGVHAYSSNHFSPLAPAPGTWIQTFGFVGGNATNDVAAGDVNNDGFPDFVVAHQHGSVYVNNRAASFVLSDAGLPAVGLVGRRGPSLADLNGDARDDLSFVNASGGVEVWLRTPAGGWSGASAGLPASGYVATKLADMNADGFADVVAYRPTQLAVWAGNGGGGGWTQIATIVLPTPGTYSAMTVGDVDRNGLPDVAIVTNEGAGLNPRNRLRVFRESSAPAALAIRVVAPPPGRIVRTGAALFVDWSVAVPGSAGLSASVRLEHADTPTGPWTSLGNFPANGRAQLRVPGSAAGLCGTMRYLRATVDTPAGVASSVSGPYTPAAAGWCYADCNGDGTLTVADFGCQQTWFAFPECGQQRDCNCDWTCTIADFSCFQNAYVLGCP
ncbi:MAG: FG-GAP repeat domain-containing protein [Phycisphaerales bacterium]